jgi:hypothetical protein
VTNYGTGRRDYVSPNSRWRAEHRCHCPHLHADDIEREASDVVRSVLGHVDDNPDTMAEADQLEDRLYNSRPGSVRPKSPLAGWPWSSSASTSL